VETPLVKRRMELEVERRLLVPYLQYNNYFWDNGPVIHNHNTWTNQDMLVCYLTFNKFPRSLEGVNKCIRSINKLLNYYPEDGGCDEGPSYYNKAAGAVIDIIEILSMVSDASYLWKAPKIRNMISYIYHAYIGGEYFVNYADAPARIKWKTAILERAGKYTGDETLLRFVAYLKASGNTIPETVIHGIYDLFRNFLTLFDLSKSGKTGVDGALFKPPTESWYPGMETVYAREPWTENGPKGFFFSAKGHHNGVNHNHNDCGNFILYLDAKPVIIDAGVEAYTSKTFGEFRYTLWTMLSPYHNTPTINNVEQKFGMQYKAKDVSYAKEGSGVKFSMDIAGAYPEEAEAEYYKREFIFDKGLVVNDHYRLKTWKAPLELNLLCYDKPEVDASKSRVLLSGAVSLGYDVALDTAIDEIKLDDPKIRNDWQTDSIFRLRLILRGQDKEGTVQLRFSRS
jgi:hypothetical protein